MVLVLLFGVVRADVVGDDEDGKKPAATPTKKPSATPRSNRNRAGSAPAAAPVEAPAVPALPTNSDGVAAVAARPQPEAASMKPVKFEPKWWSHTKPSFCEEKPDLPPLLPPEGVDPRFQDRWDRFSRYLRLLIKDGEAANLFFELARVICPPEVYNEMAQDAFDWVVDARMKSANRHITRRAGQAAERARQHARSLGCDAKGAGIVYDEVRDNLINNMDNDLGNFVDDFNNDFRASWNRREVAMGVSASALAVLAALEEEDDEEEDDERSGSAKKRRRKRQLKSAPFSGKKPRNGSGSSDESGGGEGGVAL